MIEALCKTWQHAGDAGVGIVIPLARVPFKPVSSWEDFFEGMVLVHIEGLREEVKCPLLCQVVDWFSAFYVEDADWFEGIFHAVVVTRLDAYQANSQTKFNEAMNIIDGTNLAKVTKSLHCLMKGMKPTPPMLKKLKQAMRQPEDSDVGADCGQWRRRRWRSCHPARPSVAG